MAGFRLEIARAASASPPHELETRLDLPLHRVRRTDIQVYESIHTQQSSNVYESVREMNLIKRFVNQHVHNSQVYIQLFLKLLKIQKSYSL